MEEMNEKREPPSNFNAILQENSLGLLPSITSISKTKYEIDYIGNGTFQLSQLNLLKNRSVELSKDSASQLSARGLQHRQPDVFRKEIKFRSNIIRSVLRSELKQNDIDPPKYLFSSFFQRALGFEKMNKLDDAIIDFTKCIKMDPNHGPSHYNRGCLFQSKAELEAKQDLKANLLEKALNDINIAVQIDPSNLKYRQTRALLQRIVGNYIDAVNDIMILKAAKTEPGIIQDLQAGKEVHVDSDLLTPEPIEIDPIIAAIRIPRSLRTEQNMSPVIDFLATSRFFRNFQRDAQLLLQVALQLDLVCYRKNDVIFEEGDYGSTFFIILDGEISIMQSKLFRRSNVRENVTLVKLYRGESFGETALEGDGVRSAGAVATQACQLFMLGERDYKLVMHIYRAALQKDVKEILHNIPLFGNWSIDNINNLAAHAILEYYGPNYAIIREGEPCMFFYIIKQGMVKLTKSIPKPSVLKLSTNELWNQDISNDVETPGIWVIENSLRINAKEDEIIENDKRFVTQSKNHESETEFNCGLIATGQFFCELAAIHPGQPSPTSAISMTSVQVYKFSKDILQQLEFSYDSNSVHHLSISSSLYNPRPDKLAYYYQNKFMWEIKRRKIVENISKKSIKLLPIIEDSHKQRQHKPMRFTA